MPKSRMIDISYNEQANSGMLAKSVVISLRSLTPIRRTNIGWDLGKWAAIKLSFPLTQTPSEVIQYKVRLGRPVTLDN